MAPSSSLSPSKKLLITDQKPKPKPKPDPTAVQPNSAALSGDQPNLSDCHCCGYRINHTNPKDRLQLLDSIWRIVLLCTGCRKAIRCGRKCPYCFRETGNSGNLFQCGTCGRKIHNDCIRDCGNWFYLGAGLEGIRVRVCVDCWVPELLKNSFRVCARGQSEDGLKDKGGDEHWLEKRVKKAKCKAVNARERPINLARNGVDLGNVVLALPALNYKESLRIENSHGAANAVRADNLNSGADGVRDLNSNGAADGAMAENLDNEEDGVRDENLDSGEDGVVGNAEFAIRLHKSMNSSPRISRSNFLENSRSTDVSSIMDWNGLTYKRYGVGRIRSGHQRFEARANSTENERTGRLKESHSCCNVNGLNSGMLPYKRDKNRRIWQILDAETMVSKSWPSQLAEMKFSLQSDYSRTRSPMESSVYIAGTSLNGNAKPKHTNANRFGQEFVGYNRTRFKQKVHQASGEESVSGECGNPASAAALGNSGLRDQASSQDPDPYCYKYTKRVKDSKSSEVKLPYITFLSEIEASAESRTMSDVTFDSFTDTLLPKSTDDVM